MKSRLSLTCILGYVILISKASLAAEAEIASIPEKDATSEEPYSSDNFYGDVKLPRYLDMNFPDSNGDKMTKTDRGATWTGKRGNVDITVSIDDKDPQADFKEEWQKNGSKDKLKKKRKD